MSRFSTLFHVLLLIDSSGSFFCLHVTEPLLILQVGISSVIFEDGYHISLLFPTDSVIFIHSLLFMSRQESHIVFIYIL